MKKKKRVAEERLDGAKYTYFEVCVWMSMSVRCKWCMYMLYVVYGVNVCVVNGVCCKCCMCMYVRRSLVHFLPGRPTSGRTNTGTGSGRPLHSIAVVVAVDVASDVDVRHGGAEEMSDDALHAFGAGLALVTKGGGGVCDKGG